MNPKTGKSYYYDSNCCRSILHFLQNDPIFNQQSYMGSTSGNAQGEISFPFIPIQWSSQRQLDPHYQVDASLWQWIMTLRNNSLCYRGSVKSAFEMWKTEKNRDNGRTVALPMAGSVDKVIKYCPVDSKKRGKRNIGAVHWQRRDPAQLTLALAGGRVGL